MYKDYESVLRREELEDGGRVPLLSADGTEIGEIAPRLLLDETSSWMGSQMNAWTVYFGQSNFTFLLGIVGGLNALYAKTGFKEKKYKT